MSAIRLPQVSPRPAALQSFLIRQQQTLGNQQMIPAESIDHTVINSHFLFGQKQQSTLDTNPLVQPEITLLTQLLTTLSISYQEDSQISLGGSWGLIALHFPSRNGIILREEFLRLQTEGYFAQLPRLFLQQLSAITTNSFQLDKMCELLGLSYSKIILNHQFTKTSHHERPRTIGFGERLLEGNEYTSEPGSLASDILQEFSYDEYFKFRRFLSEEDNSEQEYPVFEQPTTKVRPKKRILGNKAEESVTKRIVGRRPAGKKEFQRILRFVEDNNNSGRTKRRGNMNKRSLVEERHRKRIDPSRLQDTLRLKKRLQQKPQKHKNQWDEANYNTMEDNRSKDNESQHSQVREAIPRRRRNHFRRLFIQEINLRNLDYSQCLTSGLVSEYQQVQIEVKEPRNWKKLTKILNSVILRFLSSSEIKADDVLFVRIASEVYSIAPPEQKNIIYEFLRHHMLYSFAKLVATTVFFVIEEEDYDLPYNKLGVLVQTFMELKKVISKFNLAEFNATLCVSQFLHHYFGDYEKETETSLPFSIKPLRVVYEVNFQGNSIEAIVSCRLAEKFLLSLDIFGTPVGSDEPISTAITWYNKYMSLLTEEQFGTVLTLVMDIEEKYPTLWTVEDFSSLLGMVNTEERQGTSRTDKHLVKCVTIFIEQHLKCNKKNYKQLLNQILKQTFLSRKPKNDSIPWENAYLAIVRAFLDFPLFRNDFVYRQIVCGLDSIKVSVFNFMAVFSLLKESLEFTTTSNVQKFEAQIEKSSEMKLNQYQEVDKIRSLLVEIYHREDRFKELMRLRKRGDNNATNTIEEAYTSLYQPTMTPELYALKFKMLLQDITIQRILLNKNPLWDCTKKTLVALLITFLLRPDINFHENIQDNSDSDDIDFAVRTGNKMSNYNKFLLSFVTSLYQESDRSFLASPLSLQEGDTLFLKSQYRLHGCKLGFRTIIDVAVVSEIIRCMEYIENSEYIYFEKEQNTQRLVMLQAQFTSGVLETWFAWRVYKKMAFRQQFHQSMFHLILKMAMIGALEVEANSLLKLYIKVHISSSSPPTPYTQVLRTLRDKDSGTLTARDMMKALVYETSSVAEINDFMRRSDKFIRTMKYISKVQKSSHFIVCAMDLLHWMLSSMKAIPKVQLLCDMLRMRYKTDEYSMFHVMEINHHTTKSLMRLLDTIHKHPTDIYKIKSLTQSFVWVQIQKHCSLIEESDQVQPGPTHLESVLDWIEKYSDDPETNSSRDVCLQLIDTILKEISESHLLTRVLEKQTRQAILRRLSKSSAKFLQVIHQYLSSLKNQV